MELATTIETVGTAVDVAGVAVIVCGALIATGVFIRRLLHRGKEFSDVYQLYRQSLGRAILLGLEFLVAGDIIRTVAVSPTFAGVGVLAVIVLVRTFLSFSLEVELGGHWPWRRPARAHPPRTAG
ncbi:hypothetical protein GCM10023194_47070 [Planotetraspora phitsanulokensis]|uniref:DUF1622 domain-containing protein n=1 Tax=Planotetraspora phitsanulokensis TaxID=575192 RepID=A0A8J3UJ15_9ACTN|nr:DUF1622 domain-containing protein [Planotetraspora phitsanulokensis]GII43199.1 hypothetical protein Pph01_82020 [Planotetraspora phitsanulokensis]